MKTTYSKTKAGNLGPKYRTPDHFKGSIFSGGGPSKVSKGPQLKFNPAQFRTQHKGG